MLNTSNLLKCQKQTTINTIKNNTYNLINMLKMLKKNSIINMLTNLDVAIKHVFSIVSKFLFCFYFLINELMFLPYGGRTASKTTLIIINL